MKYFERNIGTDGAYAKYYIQEADRELDINRKFPVMVICPGGAYYYTSFREDEPIAMRFLAEGFHVIVVHYATEGRAVMENTPFEELPENPVSRFPYPLVTVASALAFLREHEDQYAVDSEHIVVSGFSAGGNVAGQLGTRWHEDWLEKLVGKPRELYRPTHLLLGYTAFDVAAKSEKLKFDYDRVCYAATGQLHPSQELIDELNPIKHISTNTPPSFVWHTVEDVLTPTINSLEYCRQLDMLNIPYELHLFNKGPHGLVLADDRSTAKRSTVNAQVYKWIDLFLEWIAPRKTERRGFFELR